LVDSLVFEAQLLPARPGVVLTSAGELFNFPLLPLSTPSCAFPSTRLTNSLLQHAQDKLERTHRTAQAFRSIGAGNFLQLFKFPGVCLKQKSRSHQTLDENAIFYGFSKNIFAISYHLYGVGRTPAHIPAETLQPLLSRQHVALYLTRFQKSPLRSK
jgi:hypothetical protein